VVNAIGLALSDLKTSAMAGSIASLERNSNEFRMRGKVDKIMKKTQRRGLVLV
jgi:hypothetical protein